MISVFNIIIKINTGYYIKQYYGNYISRKVEAIEMGCLGAGTGLYTLIKQFYNFDMIFVIGLATFIVCIALWYSPKYVIAYYYSKKIKINNKRVSTPNPVTLAGSKLKIKITRIS